MHNCNLVWSEWKNSKLLSALPKTTIRHSKQDHKKKNVKAVQEPLWVAEMRSDAVKLLGKFCNASDWFDPSKNFYFSFGKAIARDSFESFSRQNLS